MTYDPTAKQKSQAKTSRIPIKVVPAEVLKKPEWIRVKAGSPTTRFYEIKQILREHKLHTVCEEARCPNVEECWGGGTATVGVTVNLGVTAAQNTVGAGTDTLSNFENLLGSGLNDTITGNTGNNLLDGAAGIDTVSYANAAAAVTVNLSVVAAQNTVGAGTDTLLNVENLTGSNFNDTLTGSASNNTVNGGLGNDTMSGGTGADSFVFNTALNAATNKDTITDFSPVDDTLVLENAIFTQFAATGAISAGTFVSNAGGVAGDANDFLLYDNTTGKLFYDADGNGAGAKVEFVTLVGIPVLSAADFTVI